MADKTLDEAKDKMERAVAAVKSEFAAVRTGRASVALFDRVFVDYYGTRTPLRQLATISTPDPQLAIVQPWDKTVLAAVEKAILQSDLGLTPSTDGNVIRVPFPPLSEERRRDLVKIAKKMAEEGRVGIRNARHEARGGLRRLEKGKEISEDDRERGDGEVQKLTDKYITQVDELLAHKEREIMEI